MSFTDLWDSLLPLGRDPGTGGYRRYSFTAADAACRGWFCDQAAQRSLRLQTDRNGNLWAHWDVPAAWPSGSMIVTGSHLDSVPDGGATWVSVHHGGGVGIGYSIHAGMVIVADGTPEAAGRLTRVLTTDPGIGVVRHADAGYAEAGDAARRHGFVRPM